MKKLKLISDICLILGVLVSILAFWFSAKFIQPTFGKSVIIPISIVAAILLIISVVIDIYVKKKLKYEKDD